MREPLLSASRSDANVHVDHGRFVSVFLGVRHVVLQMFR
jgi:hypothetical protein